MNTHVLGLILTALAQPPNVTPEFVAQSSEVGPVRGRLIRLTKDGGVQFDVLEKKVEAGNLLSLRRADRPLPSWPRGPQLILANGDRIAGTVIGGDAQVVRVRPGLGGADAEPWRLPLTTLTAIWVTSPPGDTPTDPAAYPWAIGPKSRDALLLRNGDTVRGVIDSFTETLPVAVRVKTDMDPLPTTFPFTGVSAVAFDPTLARVRKPKGPFTRLVLADGSRLGLAEVTSDGTTLSGTTLFGAALRVRIADVIAVDVLQGKAMYLSDLKPRIAKTEPFNGVAWPWVADRSAKGNPLRLGDSTYDKGLGTHPRTTITYDLNAKYRRFEALVGLDAATGRRGAAEIRVLVDGKEVLVEAVNGGEEAKAVAVDVAKATQLTLIVGFGLGGDVQADVNWADARVVE